jgi:hypothetical protein
MIMMMMIMIIVLPGNDGFGVYSKSSMSSVTISLQNVNNNGADEL